ncbi:response regulator [Marinagarivorans algicola]|uniref:response regulator n=1 Tax=Marinagarivorans algicola TaxID=1513270 RepID=UPI0006B8F5AF|nr:response regulator [Marinagarivorans algicola]
MTKRALIVDDSRTAQMRLRKMLEKFDVEIDTSNSAEEALGYLSYRQPAVIFLDHHMEGMSGLSALKIIKSNPATALIPVVMYTSEQGDVYVGQARALGALDIISKEVIQSSSIEKVLTSLGIAAANNNALNNEPDAKPKSGLGGVLPTSRPSHSADFDSKRGKPAEYIASNDLNKVQAQVGKLFEIHIAKVRQEIEDNTKFLMRRLSKEIQDKSAPKVGAVKPDKPVAVASVEAQEPVSTGMSGGSMLFSVLVFLALVFVGYQLFASHQTQEIANEQYEILTAQSDKQNALVTKVLEQLANERPKPSGGPDARVMLDALGWAVNMNPQVAFGTKPLDDQRIYMLGDLLALLKAANFTGTIFIDVHMGNYCAVQAPSGEWILPDEQSNIEECTFLADQDLDLSLNEQVSVGFLNYLHSTPVLTEGGINVELANLGFDSPKYSYPPTTSATSAGEWNASAAQNSRLSFSFTPE